MLCCQGLAHGGFPRVLRYALCCSALLGLVLLGACSQTGASTELRQSPQIQQGLVTYPPTGWRLYCAQHPTDPSCLTERTWRKLHTIHRDVNQQVRYRPDRRDYWKIAEFSGDCEDYALRYRADLLAAGWQDAALSVALCRLPSGEAHASLFVATDHGVKVLDNRAGRVLGLDEITCTYLTMQQFGG